MRSFVYRHCRFWIVGFLETTTSKSSAIILINLCCSKSTSVKVKFTCSDYLFTYLTSSPSVLTLDLDPCSEIIIFLSKARSKGEDENEHVANMFSCLCTLLNSQENRNSFRRLEGMELMIRLIKARNFTSSLALRTYFLFFCQTSSDLNSIINRHATIRTVRTERRGKLKPFRLDRWSKDLVLHVHGTSHT